MRCVFVAAEVRVRSVEKRLVDLGKAFALTLGDISRGIGEERCVKARDITANVVKVRRRGGNLLYADALKDYDTVVLDTRKTTPGFRNLEKYSVAVGGATNHRIGLFDRIMIKDNHRELAAAEGDGAISRAVARARKAYPDLEIEVEADSLDEVREAATTGAEYIMLDNMDDATMLEAVKIVAGRAKLEASGGITLERLGRIGKTGVDYVSSGALTHSVKSADISLDIEVQ